MVEVTGDITKVLCGRTRPIHFRGVTTVVSKLFNLSRADRAYFGFKRCSANRSFTSYG